MQVNSIQSNQNFGMALKISPEATDTLKRCSTEELSKIREIGEKMKDFKFADLELDKFLEPTVINKSKNEAARAIYYPISANGKSLNIVTRPARDGSVKNLLSYQNKFLTFDTNQEAKEAMEILLKKSGIDAAAEYANLVEKSEQHLAYLEKLKHIQKSNIESMAKDLTMDFKA